MACALFADRPFAPWREPVVDLYRIQTLECANGAHAFALDSQHSEVLARNFTVGQQRPWAGQPRTPCGGKQQPVYPRHRADCR